MTRHYRIFPHVININIIYTILFQIKQTLRHPQIVFVKIIDK